MHPGARPCFYGAPFSRPRRAISDPGPHIAVPFGKYLLIKRLAVGGMAELFLAQDEPEAPLVVIKRILPYLTDDPSFVQMFLDEARIAAQLHHPNIVRVHELGKLDEAIFISMEFVEGADLRKMLQQEQKENSAIPYAVAARIVAEVCAGLHYAHHGVGVDGRPMEIVHRDVSPQNVMVGFDGQVKLVDFGIARANAFMERSKPGVLKGKFLYLSPEQVMQEALDHRSDLFAIGTLLYEITTGKSPFQRHTPEAVIFAIRREDPPSPQLVRSDYPPELSAIVARCLTKDRNKRYQEASEIRADLETFLAHTRQVGSAEVAEYAQLLFGDEDERTILNIPLLQGTSQATLLVAPVLARPPSRRQEPMQPMPPPPSELPSVTHPVNVHVADLGPPPDVATNDVVLSPADATPVFTARPKLEPIPVTQPGHLPNGLDPVPLEDRDTGELSISLGGVSAVTENERGPRPFRRATPEPLPPVIVSPLAPRRPTRAGQLASMPFSGSAAGNRADGLHADFQPEPTGSTTLALPTPRAGLKILLFCVGAVALLLLGALLGRWIHAPKAAGPVSPHFAPAPVQRPDAPEADPLGQAPALPDGTRGEVPAPVGAAALGAKTQPASDPSGTGAPLAQSGTAPLAAAPHAETPSSASQAALTPLASPTTRAALSAAATLTPPLHVVFRLSRGASVELLGHHIHAGEPVEVPAGRTRYTVRCPGRHPVERHLQLNSKSSKTQLISLRCPLKGAK